MVNRNIAYVGRAITVDLHGAEIIVRSPHRVEIGAAVREVVPAVALLAETNNFGIVEPGDVTVGQMTLFEGHNAKACCRNVSHDRHAN